MKDLPKRVIMTLKSEALCYERLVHAYKYTYEGLAEACNNDIEIRSVVL